MYGCISIKYIKLFLIVLFYFLDFIRFFLWLECLYILICELKYNFFLYKRINYKFFVFVDVLNIL